jgi:hypothetical protein
LRSTCNEYVSRPFEETSERAREKERKRQRERKREREREVMETTDLENGATEPTEGTELKADASN